VDVFIAFKDPYVPLSLALSPERERARKRGSNTVCAKLKTK
jgi:hypothetical protein